MDKVKSFKEFIQEQDNISQSILLNLNENLKSTLTIEEEQEIDEIIDLYVEKYLNNLNSEDLRLDDFNYDNIEESFFGTLLGGLTGLALGKTVGKIIAKVMGVEKGFLYNLLTSRLVAGAVGAALGNNLSR